MASKRSDHAGGDVVPVAMHGDAPRRSALQVLASASASARASASYRSSAVTRGQRASTCSDEVAPAGAEIGDAAVQVVRQVRGQQSRRGIDAVPGEHAGAGLEAAAGHIGAGGCARTASALRQCASELELKQPIAATDGLHTGAYGKTLTFTLSTTTP